MPAQTSAWDSHLLDLDAYLERVGADGALDPTVATVERLYRGHRDAIPFENVTALLDGRVPLGVPSLQDKMVHRRRGGYCGEHVVLFAAVLERIGLPVHRLAARVQPASAHPPPRTHLLLVTEVEGVRLLCDIGFGVGVLAPLPLTEGTVQQGAWTFRLARDGATWILSSHERGGWQPLHAFTEEPLLPSDAEMANHYVATWPTSPFARRLIVMRADETERRSLLDRTLVVRRGQGEEERRELSPDEALAVLRADFGVELDDGESTMLRKHLARGDGPDAARGATTEEPARVH